jgi:HPr kinase/phosphorylase
MEVRGLGIINIVHLFGVAATRQRKRVELVVRLTPWDAKRDDCDRLGLDHETEVILGVEVPLVRLPVATGRNLSNLIEVAARNLLLRLKGLNPARELETRLQESMGNEIRFTIGRYDIDEGDLE